MKKYNVQVFAIIGIVVPTVKAASPSDAVKIAVDSIDVDLLLKPPHTSKVEWAEEYSHYLVEDVAQAKLHWYIDAGHAALTQSQLQSQTATLFKREEHPNDSQ